MSRLPRHGNPALPEYERSGLRTPPVPAQLQHGNQGEGSMAGCPIHRALFARWVGKHNPFQASVILSGAKRSRKIRGCFQGCRVLHVSPLRHGNPGRCRHEPRAHPSNPQEKGCPFPRALCEGWEIKTLRPPPPKPKTASSLPRFPPTVANHGHAFRQPWQTMATLFAQPRRPLATVSGKRRESQPRTLPPRRLAHLSAAQNPGAPNC